MLLLLALACHAPERASSALPDPPSRIAVPAAPAWPAPGALRLLAPRTPPGWRRPRLVLDPGHGAPGNEGNTSVACRHEADEMLRVARALRPALQGAFDVRMSRDGELVGYRERIAAAATWGAAALVSLHSDAREGSGYGVDAQTGCPTSDGGRGFAVLWSDEGPDALVAGRQRLARAVAARLRQTGFLPYEAGYDALYGADPEHPGVSVDRHEPAQRIAMLRRPAMPSVIVETHQALDPADVARWDQPETLLAFGAALRAGVIDALAE
ncbi:MAG: N-acetylmuramoyl-L-alanine amidase [Myxococcota bacterium]